MAFNGKSINRLKSWWASKGNRNITIWLDYSGELAFYDRAKQKRVARVMKVEPGPYFIDFDQEENPFTKTEYTRIERFVRFNNW